MKRRGITIHGNPTSVYSCIYFDSLASGCVVGIPRGSLEQEEGSGNFVCKRAEVLVTESGQLLHRCKCLSVVLVVSAAAAAAAAAAASSSSATPPAATNVGVNAVLSKEVIDDALEKLSSFVQSSFRSVERTYTNFMNPGNDSNPNHNNVDSNHILAGAVVAILCTSLLINLIKICTRVLFIFIPLYVVMVCTCPRASDFDAKKELKRILRGSDLPDDHPDKPKSWLEKTAAKISASVQVELTTAAGYEVSIENYFNAFQVALVRVHAINSEFVFIGCLNKWMKLYDRQYDQ